MQTGYTMARAKCGIDAGLPVRQKIDSSANRLLQKVLKVIHAGDGNCVADDFISVRFDDWRDDRLKNQIFRDHVNDVCLEYLNRMGYVATGSIHIGRLEWVPNRCFGGTTVTNFEICVKIRIDLTSDHTAPTKP